MKITDLFNNNPLLPQKNNPLSVIPVASSISSYFNKKQAPVVAQKPVETYNIPPVIPAKYHPVFIEQAKLAGVHPNEFAAIARREQGATTTPGQAALVGKADPTDKGVMQVNKQHDKLIQQRFMNEIGRPYNPNDSVDSIIAARMVLEENKRQFEQMKKNQTYTQPYTNQDLIDSYNLGVTGLVKAKQGDKQKLNRLTRYQNAGR